MFWKRAKDGRVRVFFYDSKLKAQKALPRKETAHLDNEYDEIIDQWVRRKAGINYLIEIRPELVGIDSTASALERFCSYLEMTLGRKKITVYIHRYNLTSYVFPFFHHVCKIKAYQDYQLYSRRLGHWLIEEKGLPDSKARYVLMSLRVFWRWLIDEGLVENGQLVLRRIVNPSKPTPLKQTVTPEAVLGWAASRTDLKLMALIGYFFSLRPQETFALERSDFIAGDRAAVLECCAVMSASKLYGRLAIRVNKQRSKDGLSPPKQHSVGLVACFDERAARLIIQLLNELPDDGPLFHLHPNSYLKLWSDKGLPNTTLKDLRRASLYHLGHYGGLEIVALKNHARHREISTTALYTRRPTEGFEPIGGPLSLD